MQTRKHDTKTTEQSEAHCLTSVIFFLTLSSRGEARLLDILASSTSQSFWLFSTLTPRLRATFTRALSNFTATGPHEDEETKSKSKRLTHEHLTPPLLSPYRQVVVMLRESERLKQAQTGRVSIQRITCQCACVSEGTHM